MFQCRPFSWFITNIASSVFSHFPAPPENSHWGLLAWADYSELCWRPRCLQPPCQVEAARYCLVLTGQDEVIRLNTAGQLGLGERCLLPAWDSEGLTITVTVCPLGSVSGPWSYNEDDLTMRCLVEVEGGDTQELCVEMRGLGGLLTLAQCQQVS